VEEAVGAHHADVPAYEMSRISKRSPTEQTERHRFPFAPAVAIHGIAVGKEGFRWRPTPIGPMTGTAAARRDAEGLVKVDGGKRPEARSRPAGTGPPCAFSLARP